MYLSVLPFRIYIYIYVCLKGKTGEKRSIVRSRLGKIASVDNVFALAYVKTEKNGKQTEQTRKTTRGKRKTRKFWGLGGALAFLLFQ